MQLTLDRPWQLYRLRRYSLALEETMKFLAQHPESSEGHCLLALIHGKEKRQKQAVESAENAIQQKPDWSYPHYVHGLVNYWFNEYQPALKSLSEALRLSPDDPDFYELISIIYAEQGDLKTSLRFADNGLELDSQHIGCQFRRGAILFEWNYRTEAETVFRNILAINTDHAPSQGFLGHILVLHGQYVEALPLLRAALINNPDWQLAQNAWKESLRGCYVIYGSIARFKEWIITHPWRYFAIAAVISGIAVAIALHGPKLNGVELLVATVPIALLGSLVLFVLLLCGMSIILALVSKILLLWDRNLRLTAKNKPEEIKPRPGVEEAAVGCAKSILWVIIALLLLGFVILPRVFKQFDR